MSAPPPELHWALVRIGNNASGLLFPVSLKVAGGGPGGQFGPPTFTYHVFDLYGRSISESVNPTESPFGMAPDPNAPPGTPVPGGGMFRRTTGFSIGGNFGIAFYTPKGALALTWINEIPDAERCETITPEQQCAIDGGTWNGTSCDFPGPQPGDPSPEGTTQGDFAGLGNAGPGSASQSTPERGSIPGDGSDKSDPDASAPPPGQPGGYDGPPGPNDGYPPPPTGGGTGGAPDGGVTWT